ncbi:MAG: transcriptional regulator [Firmicutes bacterium]|nr:transcriptional regulator [Bacillota bacterium]
MNITEVSKKFDLSPYTLRYYERIGVLPKVTRNKSGVRDYSEADCRWVEFVKCMKGAGLPIEVLIAYVPLFQQGDTTKEARKALLVEQRDHLVERIMGMQKAVDRLNAKIKRLNEAAAPKA